MTPWGQKKISLKLMAAIIVFLLQTGSAGYGDAVNKCTDYQMDYQRETQVNCHNHRGRIDHEG